MADATYNSMRVVYNGKSWTYDELSEKHDMVKAAIRSRVRKGWTPEEVVRTPKGRTPERLQREGRICVDEPGVKRRKEADHQRREECIRDHGRYVTWPEALTMRWVGG